MEVLRSSVRSKKEEKTLNNVIVRLRNKKVRVYILVKAREQMS
jgi:hypothetical protein